MPISIRSAVPADFEAIFQLMQAFATFQKTPEKLLTSPQQMLDDQHLLLALVATTEEGEIIGFASYFFSYHSWSGKALYLDDLYVSQAFRGRSIGTHLLQAIVSIAKEHNCKQVRWLVSSWNKAAIAFYQKMGAVIEPVDITCILHLDNK